MYRILFFVLLVFALGFGFSWLADRPGDLVLTWGNQQIELSLMVAAVAVVALVAAIMISWWLVSAIWRSPQTVAGYFRHRRIDKGYRALSSGIIAAGAGDNVTARKMSLESSRLLAGETEPLIRLLDAQTAMLEGDHDAARAKFQAMVDDPATRMLGLRGLYLEAQQLGDRAAAKHYAEEAIKTAPHLKWAGEASLELRTTEGDWDGALQVIETQKNTKQIDKETAKRLRAVLLTARAMEVQESDPTTARNSALEAHKLAPNLAPAAVAAARALVRLGDLRKGASVLEDAWKREPHPDIAGAYVHLRSGDSVQDRLKRAQRLESLRTNHAESRMIVARAALDAGEYRLARDAAEAVLRLDPREGVYLLLADIEEAESAGRGDVRPLLAKAVKAPRDKAWTADGYVSENWAPFSPVTGKIDAFEWKTPVERVGPVIDTTMEVRGPSADETRSLPSPHEAETVEPLPAAVQANAPAPAAKAVTPTPSPGTPSSLPAAPEPMAAEAARIAPKAGVVAASAVEIAPPPDMPAPRRSPGAQPDDPGVDTAAAPEEPRRFRLF